MMLRSLLQRSHGALAAVPAWSNGLAASHCLEYDLDLTVSSCAALARVATPAVTQRQFATPSGGPPQSKLRAVPFTITPFEAQQTFGEHHAKSWLHKQPSGGGSYGSMLQVDAPLIVLALGMAGMTWCAISICCRATQACKR